MEASAIVPPQEKPQNLISPPTLTRMKTLPADFCFPSDFPHREFVAPDEESSLVVLTTQGSRALYREFISLNAEWCFRFSLIGETIYFDDLEGGYESFIHEAAVEHFAHSFFDHSYTLRKRIDSDSLLRVSTGRRVGDVGVPDVATYLRSRAGFNEDPNLVVEVASSVSLRDTHVKIAEYFARVPSITAALIVHVPERKWRTLDSGMLDCMGGTMVVFFYERPQPTDDRPMVVAARSAVSFGNDPLTVAEYEQAREITGVPQAAFIGYGAREEDPPCTAMGQDLYTLRIPAAHLLAHDADDETGDAMVARLLAMSNNDEDALSLSIDLFELKTTIVVEGAHCMNHDRATADNQRPALPEIYR